MNEELQLELIDKCLIKNLKKIANYTSLSSLSPMDAADLSRLNADVFDLYLRKADQYLIYAFQISSREKSEAATLFCLLGLQCLAKAEIHMHQQALGLDSILNTLQSSKARLHGMMAFFYGQSSELKLSQLALVSALDDRVSEIAHHIKSFLSLQAMIEKSFSIDTLKDLANCSKDISRATSRLLVITDIMRQQAHGHTFFRPVSPIAAQMTQAEMLAPISPLLK